MKIVIHSLPSCFSFTVHLRILRSLGNIFAQTSEARFPRCRYLGKGVVVFPRCPWPTRGCHEVCRLIFDKCRFLAALSELSVTANFRQCGIQLFARVSPEYNARFVRIYICVCVCVLYVGQLKTSSRYTSSPPMSSLLHAILRRLFTRRNNRGKHEVLDCFRLVLLPRIYNYVPFRGFRSFLNFPVDVRRLHV